MPPTLDEIIQLTRLVRAKTGDANAAVREISPLPGHAGFGYSFILDRTTPGAPVGKLVLRVAPEGVRISGPADVIRQAQDHAVAGRYRGAGAADLWYGDEAEFFGRPYFVDGFVDGFKLADVAPISAEKRAASRTRRVEKLAALHRVPLEPRRDAWGSAPS